MKELFKYSELVGFGRPTRPRAARTRLFGEKSASVTASLQSTISTIPSAFSPPLIPPTLIPPSHLLVSLIITA